MGVNFADQFSFLHYSVGAVFFYWVPRPLLGGAVFFLMHTIFELVENSNFGVHALKAVVIWPGGKPKADTMINILGDTVFAMLGFYTSYVVNVVGEHFGWYQHTLPG